MSKPADDPFSTFDAAYVLGALSSEDRAAFEQHLKECPDCARSVQELAGLPGLLSQLTPDMVATEMPPAELLPSVVNRVRKARRRRTFATFTVGVAASAAVVVSILVPQGGDTTPGTAMTPLGSFPVQANATLADAPSGSRVDMSCRYHGGSGGDYLLVAVQADGTTQQLASWRAVPDDTARISVSTELRRDNIQALEIRTPTGKPLLRWNP